jgi:hypothetical protein
MMYLQKGALDGSKEKLKRAQHTPSGLVRMEVGQPLRVVLQTQDKTGSVHSPG